MPNADEPAERPAHGPAPCRPAVERGGPAPEPAERPEPDEAAEHGPATRRVTVERGGPLVVEGPVEVVTEDGTVAVSRRFAVAICTCGRSATYPWCDTSHRARERLHGRARGQGGAR